MARPMLTTPVESKVDQYKANVVLESWARWLFGILALATLGFGGYLAWDKADGVATAVTFAVALLCGLVAIGGVLPPSVREDVSVEIERAKEEGKIEGAHDAAVVAASQEPGRVIDEIVATMPDAAQARLRPALEIVSAAAAADPATWRHEAHDVPPV
jgi:hypothetical protein